MWARCCSIAGDPPRPSLTWGGLGRNFGQRFNDDGRIVLRGLDYLRNAGIKPDSRVSEAVEIVIERRHQNGRWPLNVLYGERIPLEMETTVGSASRWNTLRALRVLRWYNN